MIEDRECPNTDWRQAGGAAILRSMWMWTKRLLIFTALCVIGANVAATVVWRGSVPSQSGTAVLPGLTAPVEIEFAANGVPTVRADTVRDGYRAIGYLHARDRLWQMEMTRRIGSGRLSELMGARTLDTDIYLRTLGLDRLAASQAASLPAELAADLDAYVEGVNHWIDSRDTFLPVEFQVLWHEPEAWTRGDSLIWGKLMSFQLSGDYRAEARRTKLLERLSFDRLAQLQPANHWGPVTLAPGISSAASALPPPPAELGHRDASNAWVLAPDRTKSRSALLANDPHLTLGLPGIWYPLRLETPALTLTGVTAAGVPFHILGHNGHVAWGMTTTYADTQDLVVLVPDPAEPDDAYLSAHGRRYYDRRSEQIRVRGGDTETIDVLASDFGPVLPSRDGRNRIALQWTGLDRNDRTAEALHALNRAKGWDPFLAALTAFGAPIQNLFYADVTGTIGVAVPGALPIRKPGTAGVLPKRSDDPSAGWASVRRGTPAYAVRDPSGGIISNANNRVVPEGSTPPLAWRHQPPHRAVRLAEALAGADGHGPEDSTRLQTDTFSVAARRLVPVMIASLTPDDRARHADVLDAFAAWDFRMDRDIAAPAIYRAWLDALYLALTEDDIGRSLAVASRIDPGFIETALTDAPDWCDVKGTDRTETCAEISARALETARTQLRELLGQNIASWRWGALHTAPMNHRFLENIPGLAALSSFPVETPGGGHTLNRGQTAGAGGAEPFANVHGAGYRAIYDLGDLDNSLFAIAGGVSGNPASPHYDNLIQDWADGRYFRIQGRAQDRRSGGSFLSLMPLD